MVTALLCIGDADGYLDADHVRCQDEMEAGTAVPMLAPDSAAVLDAEAVPHFTREWIAPDVSGLSMSETIFETATVTATMTVELDRTGP